MDKWIKIRLKIDDNVNDEDAKLSALKVDVVFDNKMPNEYGEDVFIAYLQDGKIVADMDHSDYDNDEGYSLESGLSWTSVLAWMRIEPSKAGSSAWTVIEHDTNGEANEDTLPDIMSPETFIYQMSDGSYFASVKLDTDTEIDVNGIDWDVDVNNAVAWRTLPNPPESFEMSASELIEALSSIDADLSEAIAAEVEDESLNDYRFNFNLNDIGQGYAIFPVTNREDDKYIYTLDMVNRDGIWSGRLNEIECEFDPLETLID